MSHRSEREKALRLSRSRSPFRSALERKVLAARENSKLEDAWRHMNEETDVHVGCTVVLHGLHVQRNGMLGIVESFVEESGRWRVRLQKSGQLHEFKPDNVKVEAPAPSSSKLIPGKTVYIHGIKSAPELNGKSGRLDTYIFENARWRVRLAHNNVLKDLKAENLSTEPVGRGEPAAAPQRAPRVNCHGLEGVVGYEATVGESCGPEKRFLIEERLGEGEFATVYRCTDKLLKHAQYALKVAKSHDHMRQALKKEATLMAHFCTVTAKEDPEGVRCLVLLAFLECFEHRGHLVASFELMKCDLRTALTKYGQGKGFPLLPTVRNFGKNIFCALRAIHSATIIHSDVKPDNFLLSRDNASIKLCDFGTATSVADRRIREEFQPRHYRAPEVILGQPFDTRVDVWSAGITFFEIATGVALFLGHTNNDMLCEMLKVLGAFPKAMATGGMFFMKHFDQHANFTLASSKQAAPLASFNPPRRPLRDLVLNATKEPTKGIPQGRHEALLEILLDLLQKLLAADPKARLAAKDACEHAFFQPGAGTQPEEVKLPPPPEPEATDESLTLV